MKRVLRCLKGTIYYVFKDDSGSASLRSFIHVDYASDTLERMSTYVHISKLGNEAYVWGCKKQNSVAIYTCEADYTDLPAAAQEMIWMRHLMN